MKNTKLRKNWSKYDRTNFFFVDVVHNIYIQYVHMDLYTNVVLPVFYRGEI